MNIRNYSVQSRSGPLIERLGTGVKVLRKDLDNPDVLADAIHKIVHDDKSLSTSTQKILKPNFRYKSAALRISGRLKDQPFSAKERVLKNMVSLPSSFYSFFIFSSGLHG